MKKTTLISCAISIFLVGCTTTQTATPLPQDKDSQVIAQEKYFIKNVAPKYNLKQDQVQAALDQAVFQPQVIALMNKPAEKKTWAQYRKLLVTPQRIAAGKVFVRDNAQAFQQEEKAYQVPATIIAGIIGVETYYGKNKGNIRVLDSLSTLSFGYPKRADFFQKELAEYLVLCQKNNWAVTEVKGSYAGAFGLSQFMPSSYRHFAVNANGTKDSPDLHKPAHAIMSVGHYLKANGWQPGGLVAVKVQTVPGVCEKLTCNQRKPKYPVATWLQNGVVTNQALPKQAKASLIILDGDKGPESWLIFNNFYVITTYNISVNYAMAVYQIGQGIRS